MARIAKKILLAIKACHPRGVIFLLALLIYVFAFFYHITLIFMKGTIAKTDDLESAMLINMAVRFLALLVMFILLLIFFVDPDEERLPVSDGESRRANIRDRTIPWGIWFRFVKRSFLFSVGRCLRFLVLYRFRSSEFRHCWAIIVDFGLFCFGFYLYGYACCLKFTFCTLHHVLSSRHPKFFFHVYFVCATFVRIVRDDEK